MDKGIISWLQITFLYSFNIFEAYYKVCSFIRALSDMKPLILNHEIDIFKIKIST